MRTMKPRSYAKRHSDALEILQGLTAGSMAGEETAQAMSARLGPLGTFAIDVVLGDVWARPQLSRRDRSLIVISVLATIGSTEELGLHTGFGLNNGLTRAEIEEVLLHVAAYAGYPMAMQASRVVDTRFRTLDGVEQLPPRAPAARLDDEERMRRAADVRRTLTDGKALSDPAADMAGVIGRLGGVGRIAYLWAFGEVWSRPDLSRRDRSMVVIAILTVLSRVDELAFHIPAGLNHGLTREEIEEIMVQMTIYGGIPRAVEGTRAMQAAFAKLDARG